MTSKARSPQSPQTPTLDEPAFRASCWILFGVFAPAGTPKAIVDRLSGEIARATRLADVREKLTGQGFGVVGSTPAEFDAFVRAEVAKWKRVIDVSGAKAD